MDCSLPGFSVPGFPRQEYWSGFPFPSPGIRLGYPFSPLLFHTVSEGLASEVREEKEVKDVSIQIKETCKTVFVHK